MWPYPQCPEDLVTFIGKILNKKIFCEVWSGSNLATDSQFPGVDILWKGTVSAEFLAIRQEIRWNYGILYSVEMCSLQELTS